MYNVDCTTTDRSALNYPCTDAYCTLPTKHRSYFIKVNASFVADFSFQRWPERALVEHKYPRKVFNWKKGKIWKTLPIDCRQNYMYKDQKDWNETQRRCRRSTYEFWIDWISNSVDQWHLQIALRILHGGAGELLYNYELPLLHPDSCDAQSSWQKLSQNLFRSSLDFLIKYLLRPPVLVKSSLVHVYFSLHHNLCKPTILWQNH